MKATRVCSVEGCEAKHYGRGYCSLHYVRVIRYGMPPEGSPPREPDVCSIKGCGRIVLARGWCSAHYQRWSRSGDPTGNGGSLRADIPSSCTSEGCGRPYESYGMCATHRAQVRDGRPVAPIESRGGDIASYVGAHQRVYAKRGPASEHACSYCPAQAAEWAYDHLDPDEKMGKTAGRPAVFSIDPDHYLPMCKPCHTRFDRGWRRDNSRRATDAPGFDDPEVVHAATG